MSNFLRLLVAIPVLAALGACALGGDTGGGGLSPGLTAQMDAPGARLDTATAIGLVNQYRATTGAGAVTEDPTLDATAQSLAQQYASTGTAPKLPAGATVVRTSSGSADFAETFSSWRASPTDAAALATGGATRIGLASYYDSGSAYGVYWVLLLG